MDSAPTYGLPQKAKLLLILEQLIADNFAIGAKDAPSPYPIEKEVKDYMDAGQGLCADLDAIAKQFNYSKYYLDRRFKKAYGISIMAYRNKMRMHTAKALLPYNSVSAVCEKLGYSSIFVFSRAFKNYFGYSPSKEKMPR